MRKFNLLHLKDVVSHFRVNVTVDCDPGGVVTSADGRRAEGSRLNGHNSARSPVVYWMFS